MHIHILGICGTFMGSLAVLAKQAGHKVTGCDKNVYPPMSTQLESQGIELISGFGKEQINLKPDLFIIGNVVSRGNELMEEILNQGLPYISGPQWLGENILHKKWVLAVAGTHGKTTTTTMLTWILEYAKLNPSYLIGGVPLNFEASARLTDSQYFVIEADEYDTAFFDKRSKFVHYRPRTAILNNLEFDHADIFNSVEDIQRQFHHLIRTIPAHGKAIVNKNEHNLLDTLKKGLWSELDYFSEDIESTESNNNWGLRVDNQISNHFEVYYNNTLQGKVIWDTIGKHNQYNGLAAIAAANHIGIDIKTSIDALNNFSGVKRRMEVKGEINSIVVYDDFAHHPSAIQTTLEGLRAKVGNEPIIAVLEPRSNTMKMGAIKDAIPDSLSKADYNFIYTDLNNVQWDAKQVFAPIQHNTEVYDDINILIQKIKDKAKKIMSRGNTKKCHILVMSNGSFGGIHQKLLEQ
jgi:UDP-N-acetylmuramate: L-alanyl-gamma-D-glutamyl-meso-diaminopimelate ligase